MDKQNARMPLVVGVTGHRDINAETQQRIADIALALFLSLRQRYPHTPVQVLSSLAAGADTVCAQAALDAGCALIVPLPMQADEYRKDFSDAEAAVFDALCAKAARVFVAPSYEQPPEQPPRGFYYRQAGICVTQSAHLLLACWDGTAKQSPAGGGTCETVRLMQAQPFSHVQDAGFGHSGGSVVHVVTPRESAPPPDDPFRLVLLDGAEQRELTTPAPELPSFACIDAFNHDAATHQQALQPDLRQSAVGCLGEDAQTTLCAEEKTLLQVYATADCLAMRFQKRRVLAFRLLALLGLLFVLLFLFYDELNAPVMLVGYGALIGVAALCYRFFTRKRFHEKYVLYRLLAEATRVQLYMSVANLRSFTAHIPWWQREDDLRFVEESCRVLRKPAWEETTPDTIQRLADDWIAPQLAYHRGAIGRKGRKDTQNKKTAQALLFLAILLFVVVAVIEAAFPWVMALDIFPALSDTISWSVLLKILLGVVSAAAAFLANYYGKLALPEQVRGSERMYRLYAAVQAKLDAALAAGDTAEAARVLLVLADAALAENLDWYTYNADNAPEFLIG